ncbi:hypothetical protein BD324DRAFT_648877 [Kockovaella imperatae]|uniref:BED-type domain-containing protein n=1 Tax=Kockovaella imperatae TaxID=4999 RepID=A0A1Y1UQH3_9TREE|nr:hypothetical protein BD324DRAFT_648877 [Kockovaella imperatae]ORX40291.1 hypothetical protein BD324DRAFT_648877 [Kockovaella imperatae]
MSFQPLDFVIQPPAASHRSTLPCQPIPPYQQADWVSEVQQTGHIAPASTTSTPTPLEALPQPIHKMPRRKGQSSANRGGKRKAGPKARSRPAPKLTIRVPALPTLPVAKTSHPPPASTSTTDTTTTPDVATPSSSITQPPSRSKKSKHPIEYDIPSVPLQLKNTRGSLLPAPPGSKLEVNELLILHPPQLGPDSNAIPINQYTAAASAGTITRIEGNPGDKYKSRFEMYTCRLCSKTYDGKNARSVARRHLQDKHGVPLALQKRRSRWDYGDLIKPERPKTAEAKVKLLVSKRQWAIKSRNQTRLERTFATFLVQFGPNGLLTPCGLRLIAPGMRGHLSPAIRCKLYPDGNLGWNQMPSDLVQGIMALRESEGRIDKYEDEIEAAREEDRNKGIQSASNRKVGSSRQSARSHPQPSFHPPAYRQGYASFFGPGEEGEPELDMDLHDPWYAAATHVDEDALQAAIAQHYDAIDPSVSNDFHQSQHPTSSMIHGYPEFKFADQSQIGQWGYADEDDAIDSELEESDEEDEMSDQAPLAPAPPNEPFWPPPGPPSDLYYPPQLPYLPYSFTSATLAQLDFVHGQVYPPHQHAQFGQFGQQHQQAQHAQLAATRLEYHPSQRRLVEEEVENPVMESPDTSMEIEQDISHIQAPVEEVAAESLLDLQSTPAKTDPDYIPSSILRHVSNDTPQGPSPLKHSLTDPAILQSLQPRKGPHRSESDTKLVFTSTLLQPRLLDAPEIKEMPNRPRPLRAMSLISKPDLGHTSRSLSFTSDNLDDDPFAMPSMHAPSKKRRSTIASPSLSIKKKREEGSTLSRSNSTHSLLREGTAESSEGSEESNNCLAGIEGASAEPSGHHDHLNLDTIGSPPSRGPLTSLNRNFATCITPARSLRSPVRPGSLKAPVSISRVQWLFSSPGNGETAATLGLVPNWLGGGGGFGTPGLNGLVSAETPVEKVRSRARVEELDAVVE